ncbi:MAG: hypothetical protein KAG20_00530 [Cocleimonas sp.]|nr:hypothetical protein [Cocleimonas sp.]
MPNVIVHDSRLEGRSPTGSIVVGETSSLATLLGRLSSYREIPRLAIMCHGLTAHRGNNICRKNDLFGGFGLQLCATGLTLENVQHTQRLQGVVETIILYACAPAHTARGNGATQGDGWRFCQELATYTNANIVASTVIQEYRPFRGTWDYLSTLGGGIVNFGHWEGPLFKFRPGGAVTRLQ